MVSISLPLHLQLLGNFRLTYADELVSSVNTARLQSLLAYLVLHRHAPHLRQHLAFLLWPDSSESQARTNLRKLFFQLQHALPQAEYFLQADSQTIGWNSGAPLRLDVAELQQHLTHLEQEPLDLDVLRRVVELYQGELLPSCYDDWIVPLRQQLHQEVMRALERLITLLENQRAYNAGIRYAQRLLAFDPLEEKTYQRLMRLHALEGDYTSALRVYQECVAVLQRELDVEPAAETQALYERLRQRDPALTPQPEQKLPPGDRLPLVGRQPEWQALQHAWRKVIQGQTHFVCIWGEAGIGKTRLAEELLDWAGKQGVLTARTRSYQVQGALAYAPVTTLLRSPTLASRLARLSTNGLTEIARLLPELLNEYPNLPPPQPMSESWQRQHFFEALAHVVLMDSQPLLLVFDDLHWCDQETLTWLHYLLHFAPQARLLVVGTSRIEEVDNAHPLRALQLGLRREAFITELELPPLNAAEVTALAHEIAENALTREQTQQLYADTEGNPLFVVETVRASLGLEAGQSLASVSSVETTSSRSSQRLLPAKVHAMIRSRLTQLSPQAQKIASLAAVIGRSFSFSVLAAAAHEEEDTLIDSLDELGERHILREQGVAEYDFSHDYIREVAYAGLSRARRRQFHGYVAQALERLSAANLDEVSSELAAQYNQAGIMDKAAHYWRRAGERALAYFAQLDALHYLERALAIVPPEDQPQRFDLLLACVKIYNHQGMREEGKRTLESLQALVRALDDGTAAAIRRRAEVALSMADFSQGFGDDAAQRAAAQEAAALAEQCGAAELTAQAYFHWVMADFGSPEAFVHLRPRLERVLALARAAGLRRLEAEILSDLAWHGLYSGRPLPELEAELQQSLAIYQQIGDSAGEAGALGMLAYTIYTQREGNYDLGIRYCERALQLATDGWDAERFALGNLGFFYYYQGDYARARPYLERQLAITQQVQNWGAEAGALLELGCLYLAQGDYEPATTYLEQALHLYRERGNQQQYRVKVLSLLALLYQDRGNYTQASAYGEEAVRFARNLGDPRISGDAFIRWGRVLVKGGQLDEAAELFRQALLYFRQMEQQNHAMMALAGLAEVALCQGELAQAQSWVDSILTYLQTHHLDCTDEELYVYMMGYRVLRATKDSRAIDLLQLAHDQLQQRAATLANEKERQLFWSALPHREVLLEMGESAASLLS
jgi:predicted ATPase/DNA-binding SARP family transcriptional activator